MQIKRFLPRSIFGRFLLIFFVPVVLVQASSIYLFYERHWDDVTRRLAIGVSGDMAAVIDLKESGWSEDALQPLAQRRFFMNFEREEIEPDPVLTIVPETLMTKTLMREMTQIFNFPFEIVHMEREEKVRVRLFYPTGTYIFFFSEKRLFSSTTYIFVMWVVGLTVLISAIALVFLRNQIRPIWQLSETADRLGRGEDVPDEKMKLYGAREIRHAALAFKRMRDRIRRQVQAQKDVLSGVSHDLRTPLTRLRLQAVMLKDKGVKENLLKDIGEMDGLVNNYLAYMRGAGDEDLKSLDVKALILDIIKRYDPDQNQIKLKQSQTVVVEARPTGLQRAITNVLTNAIKYGQIAKVSLVKNVHTADIVVEDNGPGIPEEDMEKVFQPFHRLETSRNSETGGIGLGLTIARQAIRDNGGDIKLENKKGKGLKVTISLPLAD